MSLSNHRMLELSLAILEAVATNRDGLSVSDVYTRFDIPRSSASVLLRTFANLGYMTRDRAGLFHVGPKAFEVGERFVRNNGEYTYVGKLLDELVAETGETAHLGILNGADVLYVYKSECSHTVRMISQVGKRVPAHATALGKALLSMLDDSEVQSLYADKPLERLTPNTIVCLDTLLEQLREIRFNGFATEQEESSQGVHCIAVPVMGEMRNRMYGLSISVPLTRLGDGLDRFKQPLLDVARKIQVIM